MKQDTNKVEFNNGDFGYYVVSHEWMQAWKDWVQQETIQLPGPISNNDIRDQIVYRRR